MLVYWLLFAYFAAGALFAQISRGPETAPRPMLAIGAMIVAVLIGFRYQVGADWLTYKFIFQRAARSDLLEVMRLGDPAYQALNWLVQQSGTEIWLVNAVCAVIFVWGLFRFCMVQPVPWAAVLLAVPYSVIVLAMGYTRQGVAVGILMAGLASFVRSGSPMRFAAYVFAAALFHRSAVVAFPLVALATNRNRAINLLLAIAVSIMLYDFFLGDALDDYIQDYIRTRYSSQGAVIRLAMNMVAVAVFWLLGRRLRFGEVEYRLWRNFCVGSILLVGLLVVLPSSTAVDRMSLYVIPLQIAVLGRLPIAFPSRLPATTAIVVYCFAVQFVWLNFAQHSKYWVPYQLFPL
ncbi:EpsG family protein [Sphingomonas hankyongi]|uniref:EpsG family protein n=1 Tax=Sphingomonas hankyongi TaxID=2908209 RepID=A0ABT0S2Q8_9SPHN|nr:EpsG family protein [Sphingomonas hankyongi]MCL6730142.1 EpsG family protein [Sphingomonas hankyongi]